MQIDLVGRKFKVWEYRVSHGSLLIRSPAVDDCEKNIDIIFKGVIYIEGPTDIGVLRTCTSKEEQIISESKLDLVRSETLWELTGGNGILKIAAAFMNLEENTMGMFESHFV